MKVQIKTHVEFRFHKTDENDLYLALQVENDEFFSEKLKFEDVLKRQMRGLKPSEKRECKKHIAEKLRKFLKILEK